ncbi:MAG: energy transducer TonB [Gemmatimonadales bacterium]
MCVLDSPIRALWPLAVLPPLLVATPAMSGQTAREVLQTARARLEARQPDSARILLLTLLCDSSCAFANAGRGQLRDALVLLGVAEFYRADDSAAAAFLRQAIKMDTALDLGGLRASAPGLASLMDTEQARIRTALRTPGESVPDYVVFTPPLVLSAPSPPYPEDMRAHCVSGEAVIMVIVDSTGRVIPGTARVGHSTYADFEVPALHTVLNARYRPASVNGQPVPVIVQQPVRFRISDCAFQTPGRPRRRP